MKKTNIIKRVLCAVLCLCMITGTLLMAVSCDSDMSGKGGSETVVIVKKDIKAGTKLTAEMFETVKRPEAAVHLNAIRDINNIEGKYAKYDLYKGEYVFAGKLSKTDPASKMKDYETNLVVTDKINVSGDISNALQNLINNSKGRTLEFPDGTYTISKPIVIPADPDMAVSLRLSDFAVIKAADGWNHEEAMFCLCAGEIPEGKELADTFYIQGGMFDGNGVATAISVENAENFLISNVDVRNSPLAFDLKGGILDMENVDIVGVGGSSVGMKVACNTSSFSNVRITNVATAVNATGANNLFKSVYATYKSTADKAAAFIDTSKGNNYDMCTSEDFATGFSMGEGNNIYYACYVKWSSADIKDQVAFFATGKYNSVIRTTRVDFDFANCGGAYLKVGATGGKGEVLWPMIGGKSNMTNTTYTSYMAKSGDIVEIPNK